MKQKGTRIFALLLAAVLLLGGLPMQALAAEDEAGWFHLAADWNGELLIKPERVPYTAEQTIYEAICAAGHTLAPNAGNVTQIDGVAGNFIRGDETGADNSYDLTRKASEQIFVLRGQQQRFAHGHTVRRAAGANRRDGGICAEGRGCAGGGEGGIRRGLQGLLHGGRYGG